MRYETLCADLLAETARGGVYTEFRAGLVKISRALRKRPRGILDGARSSDGVIQREKEKSPPPPKIA